MILEQNYEEIIKYLNFSTVNTALTGVGEMVVNIFTLIFGLSNYILSFLFFFFAYNLEKSSHSFQIKEGGVVISHKKIYLVSKYGSYTLSIISVLCLFNILQFIFMKVFSFLPNSLMIDAWKSLCDMLGYSMTKNYQGLFNIVNDIDSISLDSINKLSGDSLFIFIGFSGIAFISLLIVLIALYYIIFKKYLFNDKEEKERKKLYLYSFFCLILLVLFGFSLLLRIMIIFSNASTFSMLPFEDIVFF
jgi:hypothetical protein